MERSVIPASPHIQSLTMTAWTLLIVVAMAAVAVAIVVIYNRLVTARQMADEAGAGLTCSSSAAPIWCRFCSKR